MNGRRSTVFFRMMVWLVLGLVAIAGCDQEPTPTSTVPATEVEQTAVAVQNDNQETRTLPTVYPTPSAFPTPSPTAPLPTNTPRPTATPIDFSELVVEAHYSIPAISLDRTIRGNVSSQLELTDETTGEVVSVTNVPGAMFELQQTLPEVTFSELPEGCELCVRISYELFLTGESGEGWVEDPVLLASFENFFSAHLGPHFPPDTIVGLRRSATPYDVAHTVALTADGTLWRWAATEPELTGPETGDSSLLTLVNDLDLESIGSEYLGACPEGSGVEQLFLANESGESSVEIVCPELSLPLPLLPLYLRLDALSDEITADTALPQPQPAVPLETVLYYQQQDGDKLFLFDDGRVQVRSGTGVTVTAALTGTGTIDTALALAESGILESGADRLASGGSANILIARGMDGVYETGWNNDPPDNLSDFTAELDSLIEDLLKSVEVPEDGTPTPESDATPGTVTPTPPDETPEATPTG
ncbi:MAG: hypothetical protein WAM60_00230 [Candidatus Promineifilaceae bacterium]